MLNPELIFQKQQKQNLLQTIHLAANIFAYHQKDEKSNLNTQKLFQKLQNIDIKEQKTNMIEHLIDLRKIIEKQEQSGLKISEPKELKDSVKSFEKSREREQRQQEDRNSQSFHYNSNNYKKVKLNNSADNQNAYQINKELQYDIIQQNQYFPQQDPKTRIHQFNDPKLEKYEKAPFMPFDLSLNQQFPIPQQKDIFKIPGQYTYSSQMTGQQWGNNRLFRQYYKN